MIKVFVGTQALHLSPLEQRGYAFEEGTLTGDTMDVSGSQLTPTEVLLNPHAKFVEDSIQEQWPSTGRQPGARMVQRLPPFRPKVKS